MKSSGTIWFDLDNSPHVLIFAPIIRILGEKGYNIVVTARNFAQTLPLLEKYNIPYIRVDGHGGRKKLRKVLLTIYRAYKLYKVIKKVGSVDLMVNHGSRAGIIASKALGIPVISAFDYEYAEIFLFLKLSNVVLVPHVLSRKLSNPKIHFYPGLKEEIYLCGFQPDSNFLGSLPFKDVDSKPLVTIRPPAIYAHYHNSLSERLYSEVLEKVLKSDCNIVLIPRTKEQSYDLKRKLITTFADKIYIPEKALDGPNLIYFSDLVISGGGTMLREAALLGTPAYSIFTANPPSIDLKLEEEKKLTFIRTLDDVSKIQIKKKEKIEFVKPTSKVRDFFISQILEQINKK